MSSRIQKTVLLVALYKEGLKSLFKYLPIEIAASLPVLLCIGRMKGKIVG